MARTAAASFPGDDFGKLLALAGALVSLGVLPKGWQKAISAATALYVLSKLL
jgi:hypothetical protein